jgi:flagellar protein FliO/FliZ
MDTVDPSRFILSFLFVLGLIGLLAMALRHYAASGKFSQAMRGGNADGRIKILEVRYLDPRRRLVLVRRDHVEHLLLLADGRETVVESGITGMEAAGTSGEPHA